MLYWFKVKRLDMWSSCYCPNFERILSVYQETQPKPKDTFPNNALISRGTCYTPVEIEYIYVSQEQRVQMFTREQISNILC